MSTQQNSLSKEEPDWETLRATLFEEFSESLPQFEKCLARRKKSYRERELASLKCVSEIWLSGQFGELGPEAIAQILAEFDVDLQLSIA